MISVNDGIVQGLTQRNFNVGLVSGCTAAPLDQEHDLVLGLLNNHLPFQWRAVVGKSGSRWLGKRY